MFDGTTIKFKVLYFITAMSPAYLVFLLQLNNKFKGKNEFLAVKMFNKEFSIYWLLLALFIALLILTFRLYTILSKQLRQGSGTLILEPTRLEEYKSINIRQRNGQVTTFLLGNILPAVLIIETSVLEAIIIFIVLQVLILFLMLKSTDLFPNIPLIIFGIDICIMANGNYLFVLKSKEEINKVKQIGDSEISKLYITAYKK